MKGLETPNPRSSIPTFTSKEDSLSLQHKFLIWDFGA